MKTNNLIQSKGAALIITLLLITVFAGIIFASSRLTTSELKQSISLEDSELAFQAAESGIEMGLLLFRYDKNIEVPNGVSGGMSEDETDQFIKFDISDGREVSKTTTMDKSKSYFDLRIWHRNDNTNTAGAKNIETLSTIPCNEFQQEKGLCIEQGVNNWVIPALREGDVVEYDTDFESSDKTNTLSFYTEFLNNTSPNPERSILFIFIDSQGRQATKACKINLTATSFNTGVINLNNADIYNATTGCTTTARPLLAGDRLNGVDKVRIKVFNGDLKTLKITAASNFKMDSRKTVIESTGYYGSTKRALRIELDRATGALLTPFDFLINTGDVGPKAPPAPIIAGCTKSKAVSVYNGSATTLTDYQVKINTNISQYKNIRFSNQSGSIRPWWTENVNSTFGSIWVNVDKIIPGQNYIYMWYDSAGCLNDNQYNNNPNNTFDLFDDFNNLIDSQNKWRNDTNEADFLTKYNMWNNPTTGQIRFNAVCSKNVHAPACDVNAVKDKYMFSKETLFNGNYSVYTKITSHSSYVRYALGFGTAPHVGNFYNYDDGGTTFWGFRLLGFRDAQGYNAPNNGLVGVASFTNNPVKSILSDPNHRYETPHRTNSLANVFLGSWYDSYTDIDYVFVTKSTDPDVQTEILP